MTLQRGLQNVVCQSRNVETQRHDVTEACVFNFFQRRDVTERVKFKFFIFYLQNFLSLRKLHE